MRAHPTSSAGYCTGWGDPHYVTFDGLYYSYQGNCTYVLVEEINPKVDNFGIYVDNYHCDVNDEVSCPRTLIVRHETQEVLIKTVQMMPIRVQVRWRGGGGSTVGALLLASSRSRRLGCSPTQSQAWRGAPWTHHMGPLEAFRGPLTSAAHTPTTHPGHRSLWQAPPP